MSLHWIDYCALAFYAVGMALMGWYFARKNVSTEEYFVGGRSYAGWVIGLSMVGTSISSATFLAYPGDAYKTAWLRFLPNFMLPLGVLIAAMIFLPFFRRGNITSAYEYLEDRFGPTVRVYAASAFIVQQLIRVSIILFLISIMIYETTGLSLVMCILVTGVFVGFYTIVGGINAVIWTDVIQTIVLMLGGIVALIIIVYQLPEGLGQVFDVAWEHGKLSFSEWQNGELIPVSWKLSLSEKTKSMMLLFGLTAWLMTYSSDQTIIQRYVASRSAREARKAMLITVLYSLPIWAFFMFLGTALYVFFVVFPETEAMRMLTGERKAEEIFPYFIIHHMPPGITGLVIAAALAASMSSLDSSINAISTVGIVDIYRRHLVKNKSDRHYLKIAWTIASAAALLMVLGAIWLAKSDTRTIQHAGTILLSIVAAGRLGLYLLGFLTRKGDGRAAWIGIGMTVLFTIWALVNDKTDILPSWLSAPFDLYYTMIIGNIIMFVVGVVVGSVFFKPKEELHNLTIYDQDKEPLH